MTAPMNETPNDDELRIAILEHFGCCTPSPEGRWTMDPSLADFCGSLDAMHEAEKTLTPKQCYDFNNHLAVMLGCWEPQVGVDNWIFHAPARLRALAFWRTVLKDNL